MLRCLASSKPPRASHPYTHTHAHPPAADLNLFRGIIPPLGGIDLSPILAFVVLDVSAAIAGFLFFFLFVCLFGWLVGWLVGYFVAGGSGAGRRRVAGHASARRLEEVEKLAGAAPPCTSGIMGSRPPRAAQAAALPREQQQPQPTH